MPQRIQPGEVITLKDSQGDETIFTIPEQYEILTCHNDIDTAFIVHDYPFGSPLRCPVAYWTEHSIKGSKAGHTRMARATPLKTWCAVYTHHLNNPQYGYAAGLAAARRYFETQYSSGKIHWNKPKFSTYSHLLCMELTPAVNSDGDIQYTPDGATKYSPSPLGLSMHDGFTSWLRVILKIGNQLSGSRAATIDAQRIHTVITVMRSGFERVEYYQKQLQSLFSQFSLENGILYRRENNDTQTVEGDTPTVEGATERGSS